MRGRVPNVLAHDATWMPDGQRLLVASGNDLVRLWAPTAAIRIKLLTTRGLAFWLRWSPDGQRLRFTLRDPKRQTSELWEVAADGSNPHPLLPGWSQPASECCGSWTPDGENFVFQSAHSGHSEIWAAPRAPWFLATASRGRSPTARWTTQAPSTVAGQRSHLLYWRQRRNIELLRAMPNSTAFIALDQNLSAAALAQYSPDGKWVAWINAADNSLWRSRVDGSERIELTTRRCASLP